MKDYSNSTNILNGYLLELTGLTGIGLSRESAKSMMVTLEELEQFATCHVGDTAQNYSGAVNDCASFPTSKDEKKKMREVSNYNHRHTSNVRDRR